MMRPVESNHSLLSNLSATITINNYYRVLPPIHISSRFSVKTENTVSVENMPQIMQLNQIDVTGWSIWRHTYYGLKNILFVNMILSARQHERKILFLQRLQIIIKIVTVEIKPHDLPLNNNE